MEYQLENERLKIRFKSLGGALSSIQDMDGTEFLWQGDPAYWSGQAPVLFPICGSLRNDRAQIGRGETTGMPRHGIVRKREFACEGFTDKQVVFSIASDEKTRQQYPYPFRLTITYTLEETRIRTEYRVSNMGEKEMPFFIGGHPGFRCPLFKTERYEDYRLEFSCPETLDVPTPVTETGLIDVEHRTPFLKGQKELVLNHGLFEKDAVILDGLRSRSVKLLSRNHDKGLRLDFPDFPYLILWSSANRGPFIALEPWIGLSTCSDEDDVFEDKRNVQMARAGEEKTYCFDITIL